MSEQPIEDTNTPDLEPVQDTPSAAPPPQTEAAGPSDCPWTLIDFFLFILLVFVTYFFSFAGFLLGFLFLGSAVGGSSGIEQVLKNPFFLIGFHVFFNVVIFGLLYLLTVVRRSSPLWPALKLHRTPAKWLQIGTLGGVLLGVGVQFAPVLLPDQESFPLKELFSTPASAYTLSLFAVTLAPFMEELIFRGFMFRIFNSRFGVYAAVLITAVLFWSIHLPQYWNAWNHLLLLAIVALALSGLRAWAGSLLPCIMMHTVYNLVVVLFLYEATDRFRKLPALIG